MTAYDLTLTLSSRACRRMPMLHLQCSPYQSYSSFVIPGLTRDLHDVRDSTFSGTSTPSLRGTKQSLSSFTALGSFSTFCLDAKSGAKNQGKPEGSARFAGPAHSNTPIVWLGLTYLVCFEVCQYPTEVEMQKEKCAAYARYCRRCIPLIFSYSNKKR